MSTTALIAGSFDPPSKGHADLIGRAAGLFDHVYVTVFVNSEKKPLFSLEQRLHMLSLMCGGYKNVTAEMYSGLLADFAEEKGVSVIVKGIRNASDAAYELELADVNAKLLPGLETVFLPSKPEFISTSSTVIREMIKYKKSISPYVTPEVEQYIHSILMR